VAVRARWTMSQNGAIMAPMNSIPKVATVRALDRLNLRLPQDTLEAIDNARGRRIGNVSRNTWITEAIQEKLNRESAKVNNQNGEI